MLANVMRLKPSGIPKPRGLARPKVGQDGADEVRHDFPLIRLADLIRAARTARNRALWLLLAASGLRRPRRSTSGGST